MAIRLDLEEVQGRSPCVGTQPPHPFFHKSFVIAMSDPIMLHKKAGFWQSWGGIMKSLSIAKAAIFSEQDCPKISVSKFPQFSISEPNLHQSVLINKLQSKALIQEL